LPDVLCIAIVKYVSQMEKAVDEGADIALVDEVDTKFYWLLSKRNHPKKPESM